MIKAIHVSIITIIIVAIVFTALLLKLNYEENGETNMPFEVSKISIISTTDGKQNEDKENVWNKEVEQNNDIYIYIEKNKDYKKTETIKQITISNFSVIEKPEKGQIQFFKPSKNEKLIFENKEEYKIEEIKVIGDQKTEIQDQKISNQGGIIAFRSSTQNLGNYVSNEKEINYDELLKKINIEYNEIKARISFDLFIELADQKQFKTTMQIDLPVEDVIEKGRTSKDITDLKLVFKRVEK